MLRLPSLVKSFDLNAMSAAQFLYVPKLTSADDLMFGSELRALYAPGLDRVGKGAFVSCKHLRRIDLPSGVDVSPLGVSPFLVMEMAGHTSAQVTRSYSQSAEELIEGVAVWPRHEPAQFYLRRLTKCK